jgi:hypothetical protein
MMDILLQNNSLQVLLCSCIGQNATSWLNHSLVYACRMLASVQVYSYFEPAMQPQLRTTLQELEEMLAAAQQQQQQQGQQQQQQVVFLDTRSSAQYTAQVGHGWTVGAV